MSRRWRACPTLAALTAALVLGSCGGGGDDGGGDGGTGPDLAAGMQAISGMFATAATTTLSGSISGAPKSAALLASPPGPATEELFPGTVEDFMRLEMPARVAGANALSAGLLPRAAGGCGSGTATAACAGGGSITAQVTLGCSGPSGCCGNKKPCSQDSMSLQGPGDETFNSCRQTTPSGDVVIANGTLATNVAGNVTFKCWGAFDVNMTITFNGNPTFTVNGKEICNGPTSVTATVAASYSISVRIAGTICGQAVDETFQEGCSVNCGNGRCCSMGSQCGTCSTGCIGIGADDCCDGHFCPAGTHCTDNDTCRY